jgi:hypothetical protein
MSMIQTGRLQLNSSNPVATSGGDTSTFTQVVFPAAFPDGSTVVVIPFVQTFNGPDTPGLRIADVTTVGFKIRINELHASARVTSDGTHTTETVGWIATTV